MPSKSAMCKCMRRTANMMTLVEMESASFSKGNQKIDAEVDSGLLDEIEGYFDEIQKNCGGIEFPEKTFEALRDARAAIKTRNRHKLLLSIDRFGAGFREGLSNCQ